MIIKLWNNPLKKYTFSFYKLQIQHVFLYFSSAEGLRSQHQHIPLHSTMEA